VSDKTECPGCQSSTSAITEAFRFGDPCPYCGLPAQTAIEVNEVRERKANADLVEQTAAALLRAGKAEAEAADLRRALMRVKADLSRTLANMPDLRDA
jgi:hypothetical protein